MRDQWTPTRLGDVVGIKHGWPFKSENFSENLSGHPVVVAVGNFRYEGGFRFGETSTKEYRGDYPQEYELSPGDILLIMTCQTQGGEILGIPGRIPADGRKYLHNQRLGKIIVKSPDLVDADFLYQLFRSRHFNFELCATASGSKILHTAPSRIEAFEFARPPLEAQRAIAGVLGALDDKIEQNRKTVRALERLARAIFRAWFVDFEPVKAKAEGATAFPSMPQSVFDALPTRFVDSPIGPVPEGWEVKALEEMVRLTMGQSPKSEFYNETGEGLPFHQGVSNFGFRFPTHRVYCTVDSRVAEKGDVLLSVRAPVGRINVADRRMILGRGLAGLRDRNGNQAFLFHQMAHVFAEEDAIGDGTIYKAVTKRFLAGMPTLAPPVKVARSYSDIARPADDLVHAAEVESRKLAEMRDYLLPKLLSGDVRVATSLGEGEEPS